MNDKLKNFLIRTLSGAVMLALLLGATLYSFWSFMALALLIVVGGMWEFYNLCKANGDYPLRIPGIVTGILLTAGAMLVLHHCVFDSHISILEAGILMLIGVILVPSALFLFALITFSDDIMHDVGMTMLGVVYVALPMALLPVIPVVMSGGKWVPWGLLWYIFIIWANDVFAYLVGVTMGRNKMCPFISPKKSWEGFFGGIFGAIAVGYLASYLLEQSCTMWVMTAFVTALMGVVGDLVESQFKRCVLVKDSGNIIPGHGGILDRFDALLVAVPFSLFIAAILKIVEDDFLMILL